MYIMMLTLVLMSTEEKKLAPQRSFGKPAFFAPYMRAVRSIIYLVRSSF